MIATTILHELAPMGFDITEDSVILCMQAHDNDYGATFNAILDGWQPEARPQEAEPPPSEAPLDWARAAGLVDDVVGVEESGWIACVRTGGHGSEVRPTPPAQDHTHCFGLLPPVATALCLGCLCRDCSPCSAGPSGRRSRGARLPSLAGMTGRARCARCSKAWEARCSIAAWSLKARPTPSTGRCWARSLAALRWGCGRDIYTPVGRGGLRAC